MEAGLMYMPVFGGGFTGLTPEVLGRMPLDKIFWHVKWLERRREREADTLGGSATPRPPPTSAPAGDD